jgi:hypothetical protein
VVVDVCVVGGVCGSGRVLMYVLIDARVLMYVLIDARVLMLKAYF